MKAEIQDIRGLFRDEQGHLFFCCRLCPQTVRVRKEEKKSLSKGTEHLFKKFLCQACFYLEVKENNQGHLLKFNKMRESIHQTAYDSDRTAFDTFFQQESTDLSVTAS